MRVRKHLLIFFGLVLGLLFAQVPPASAASGNAVPVTLTGKSDYKMAYEVLKLTNQLRTAAGKKELAMDGDLMKAAMQRAAETRLIFDHSRPNRNGCQTVFPTKVHGENITISYGWTTAQEPVDAWHASAEHYKNLLTDNYRSTGIGCFRSNGVVCWVQLFGYYEAEPPAEQLGDNVSRIFQIDMDYFYLSDYARIVLDKTYEPTNAAHTIKRGESKDLKLQFFYPMDRNGDPTEDVFTYPHNYMDSDVHNMPSLIPELEWSDFSLKSSDPTVLTVNSSGRITGKKAGTVTVTATHRQVPDAELSLQITVSDTDSRSVRFNANGGSLKKNGKQDRAVYTYTYGKKYGSLPEAYRSGYVFSGWYTAKTGGSQIKKSTVVRINRGTVKDVYARWSKIKVNAPTIKKASSPASAKLKVTWKKMSGISGYQIEVSTSDKFGKKTEKTITLKGTSKTSCTFAGLKKRGTKYYVRVRAYRTDSAGNKIYGKYSKVLSAKVKK